MLRRRPNSPCDFGTFLPEAGRTRMRVRSSVVLACCSQNWLVSVKNSAEDPGSRPNILDLKNIETLEWMLRKEFYVARFWFQNHLASQLRLRVVPSSALLLLFPWIRLVQYHAAKTLGRRRRRRMRDGSAKIGRVSRACERASWARCTGAASPLSVWSRSFWQLAFLAVEERNEGSEREWSFQWNSLRVFLQGVRKSPVILTPHFFLAWLEISRSYLVWWKYR